MNAVLMKKLNVFMPEESKDKEFMAIFQEREPIIESVLLLLMFKKNLKLPFGLRVIQTQLFLRLGLNAALFLF